MMDAAELKANIANTLAFINANPTSIVLTPVRKYVDGTGTHYADEPPRPAQTFRLIDQSTARERAAGVIRTSDGQDRLAEWMLLGKPDAVVGLYDHWQDDKGTDWEVVHFFPSNGYELRATVVAR